MALDAGQVLKAVYDATSNRLQTQNGAPPTSPRPETKLTANQIWKRVYDSTTGKLRIVCV